MRKTLLLLAVLVASIHANAATWKKVTTADELTLDGEYVVACDTKSVVMSGIIGSNKYLPSLNATFNNGELTSLPANTAIVHFEGSDLSACKMHILLEDGTSKGYYTTSAAKSMSLSSTGGTNANVSIANNGEATIKFGSYGTLYYNSGSPRFVNYTSNQTHIQLYKKVVEETPVQPSAPVVGTYEAGKSYEIEKGTTVSVTAENAKKIIYTINGGTEVEVTNNEIVVNEEGTYVFTAINGEYTASITITFTFPEVTVAPEAFIVYVNGTETTIVDETLNVTKGDEIKLYSKYAESIAVEFESGNDNVASDTYIFTAETGSIVSATATNKIGTTDIIFTLNVEIPKAEKFYQLTDASYLKEGDKLIIVNKEHNKAASNEQKPNNRPEIDITFDGVHNAISVMDKNDVLILRLEGQEGEWLFHTTNYADAQGYLTGSGNDKDNYLTVNTTISDNSKAKISFDQNGNAVVVFNFNGRNTWKYNSSGKIFSAYGSGQQHIQLYTNDAVSVMPLVTYKYNEAEAITAVEVNVPEGLHVQYIHKTTSANGVNALAEEDWQTIEANTYSIDLTDTSAQNLNSEISFRSIDPETQRVSPVSVHNILANGTVSGIADIELGEGSEAEYFNLQGVRVAEPTTGLYLRRIGGKVEKVIIR